MAAVIPVRPADAPPDFDARVRQPGLRWLEAHGISLDTRLEPGTKIHPYWRECLDDLHTSYDGICAYLCVFVERCTGGASTDHFVAKSTMAGLAYEWSNYRLACATMNARKRDFEGMLDPVLPVRLARSEAPRAALSGTSRTDRVGRGAAQCSGASNPRALGDLLHELLERLATARDSLALATARDAIGSAEVEHRLASLLGEGNEAREVLDAGKTVWIPIHSQASRR